MSKRSLGRPMQVHRNADFQVPMTRNETERDDHSGFITDSNGVLEQNFNPFMRQKTMNSNRNSVKEDDVLSW